MCFRGSEFVTYYANYPQQAFSVLLKVSMRNPNAKSKISTMFKVNFKDTKTISLPKPTAIYSKLMHYRYQNGLPSAVFFCYFCTHFASCSILSNVDFEQVNVHWALVINKILLFTFLT